MPRRDQISEKKRDRLAQENAQLQQLMLQARSSVRRSSLKDRVDETVLPEEANEEPTGIHLQASEIEAPAREQDIKSVENKATQPEPLTERDLFPAETMLHEPSRNEQTALTEDALFPQDHTTPPKTAATITVVLPRNNNRINPVPEKQPAHQEAIAAEAVAEATVPEAPVYESAAEQPGGRIYEDRETKPARSRTGMYILMLAAALLLGFGAYYLYFKNKTNAAVIAEKSTNARVTTTKPPVATRVETPAAPYGDLKKLDSAQHTASSTTPERKLPEAPPAALGSKPATTTENAAKGKAVFSTVAGNSGDRYKVVSKAYFHDSPDESTRRKAFIIHWNNAVLAPLEEKNGFIYVIFTNHLGQTSKGWLRKKDLTKLN